MRAGPNLYALTYVGIADTKVKYDPPYKADTLPLHLWKDEKADQRVPRKAPKARGGLDRLPSAGGSSAEKNANVISFPSQREAA